MKLLRPCSVLLLCFAPALATAQVGNTTRIARRPASRNTVLQIENVAPALARHAAIIFSGRVVSINRLTQESGAASDTVQITFVVDNAIRGVFQGDRFRLLEWPGRWQAGEHYSIGERYLLFLHTPNAAGLTSPVGGGAGRFLIAPDGTIDISPARLLIEQSRSDASSPLPRSGLPHPAVSPTPPTLNPRIHTE